MKVVALCPELAPNTVARSPLRQRRRTGGDCSDPPFLAPGTSKDRVFFPVRRVLTFARLAAAPPVLVPLQPRPASDASRCNGDTIT